MYNISIISIILKIQNYSIGQNWHKQVYKLVHLVLMDIQFDCWGQKFLGTWECGLLGCEHSFVMVSAAGSRTGRDSTGYLVGSMNIR